MGLIGTVLDGRTTHPQPFIDALYEEIFDHHPEDVEIDVFVIFKTLEKLDEERILVSEVTDFVISRIGRDLLLDDHDDLDNFRQAVEWADNVIDGDESYHFVFIHKHHPGFPEPGEKDFVTNDIIATIDFALGNDVRLFTLMSVVNRDASTPMRPSSNLRPIGLIEVDGLTAYRMGTFALQDTERPHEPEDVERFTALIERQREMAIYAKELRLAGDYDAIEAMQAEYHTTLNEAARIAMKWAPEHLVPPELRELMDVLERMAGIAGVELQRIGLDDGGPLGYDVPQIEMLPPLTPMAGEPGEPRPQPGNIFDLPDLDPTTKPDPEIRWEN